MHNIDLSRYDLRTDLIIEENINGIKNNSYDEDNIHVDDIVLESKNKLKRKKGKYVTITYNDITDSDNFSNVLKVLNKELIKVFKYCKIKDSDTCLIIGLGNRKIISDSLGSKTIEDIIVTRHMYMLGDVDKRFRNVSILEPNVPNPVPSGKYSCASNNASDVNNALVPPITFFP